jgi:hypothetical protein
MNVFRINKFSLLRFYNDIHIEKYFDVSNPSDSGLVSQYVINDDNIDTCNNVVWFSGDYDHRLNKTYLAARLFDPETQGSPIIEDRCNTLSLMVIQGYSWKDLFGLLIVIRNIKSRNILLSKIVFQSDLHPTLNKELIDGSFWLEEALITIPYTDDLMEVEIIEIQYKDIIIDGLNIGYIYNYPRDLIPLIAEKQTPDFIQSKLELDLNNYLSITPITTELKSLEKSILDYFGVSLASITIKHIIKYGTDELGYKTIAVSNEDNVFGPINIGLNLAEFSTPTNDDCTIFVSTEYTVDGKMMKRENTITTKLLQTINPLIAGKIVPPDTKYPVTVEIQNVVNQQVIEAKEKLQTVIIYQPVFTKFIENDFVIENVNIYFDKIVNETLMIIGEGSEIQQLLSDKTEDKQIYFDLSKLDAIKKDTIYTLTDVNSGKLIGSGKILKSNK